MPYKTTNKKLAYTCCLMVLLEMCVGTFNIGCLKPTRHKQSCVRSSSVRGSAFVAKVDKILREAPEFSRRALLLKLLRFGCEECPIDAQQIDS